MTSDSNSYTTCRCTGHQSHLDSIPLSPLLILFASRPLPLFTQSVGVSCLPNLNFVWLVGGRAGVLAVLPALPATGQRR